MNSILDSKQDTEVRIRTLLLNPELTYEAVFTLLGLARMKKDPKIIEFIQEVVEDVPLPVATVLDLVTAFKDVHRDIAHKALILNAQDAVQNRSFLHFYIRECIKAKLPLGGVEAHLVTELDRLFHHRLNEIPILLRTVGNAQLVGVPRNAQIDGLMERLSRHLFDLYSVVGLNKKNGAYFTLCVHLMELTSESVKAIISWIPNMTYNGSADIIDAFKRRIVQSNRRDDFRDDYLKLDAVFQGLREKSGNKKASRLSAFVENKQNVHWVFIEREVIEAFDKLEIRFAGREDSLDPLRENPNIQMALYRIENDPTDFHGRTLEQLLRLVFLWAKDADEMPVLIQELQDMTGTCASGHFRRLVNVLNGYEFELLLPDTERTRRAFFDRVNQLIQEQPDCDEIVEDIPGRAAKYADMVAKEMMLKTFNWEPLMDARRQYLHGE